MLTWGVRLAVILQVIQAPAHYLHGHLILSRPCCQPQFRLQDTTSLGPDGPAAIHPHSQAQHCSAKLIGNGWCVTPSTWFNKVTRACKPGSKEVTNTSPKGLTREIHTGGALSHHPLPRCWQLHWLSGYKVLGCHDSLADQDLLSPLIMAGSSNQQGRPDRRGDSRLHGAANWGSWSI